MRHLTIAVLGAWLGCAAAARAACPAPVLDRSYQKDDGSTVNVYRVPPGTNGEDCTGAAADAIGKSTSGNSAGTSSFELQPTGAQALAECLVKIVDGTTMRMRGLPRITGGRFTFTNDQGQLVQLPLREVASTDSGRRFRCTRCARDAAGRPIGSPEVQAAFVGATPCPATKAVGGACPGYVVDHVTPLDCGGEDEPANLQWQTEAEAKRKEAWRSQACKVAS